MAILQLIEPEVKDLGGFVARRSLPYPHRQMVGPFIFFDHLGPSVLPPNKGIDVRPHPHINLATLTYLFDGAIMHRDSLGTVQEIQPGAVNWMTAGTGIVHSERSPDNQRHNEASIHGIQTWIALPVEHEETDPWFVHYPAQTLPSWEENGCSIKLIAGEAFGYISPVKVFSPILYLDVVLSANAQFTIPTGYSEIAVYSVTDGLSINDQPLEPYRLAILEPGHVVKVTAAVTARCIVIGGEPLGTRYKWWNFVSSRPERIEQAKADWRDRRYPSVPDETEFIPLPEVVTEANPL
ncbi:pirin family protein [Nostoc sp. FACHB-152]|uniref:pirin family protein n=1 Tax=unclassified Nostoc TaxID=2593658 RepID=UPI0016882E3A|nr:MULTISPECIES: pirin family protein [unclassified Nostoc]MBD2445959.1 pirin family protein [Nostoc sp. FACHB-152]MBD2467190.1 pirin family protein [Nostoc sp. FACHB-145]